MKFFAPTSLWRFAGAEFSAIAASGPRARVCDVTGCETFWLGSSAKPNFSRRAAAREIDPTSRATASLSRTRRGTRVTRGFARESHRIPGTDGDGDMGEVKLPEDVKEQLEKFEAAVEEMEKGLKPLLSADRKEMEAALDPLERARVHIALANSVSTLYASE